MHYLKDLQLWVWLRVAHVHLQSTVILAILTTDADDPGSEAELSGVYGADASVGA